MFWNKGKIRAIALSIVICVICTLFPAMSVQAQVTVAAPSVILIESSTGQIIYEVNSTERRSPASITKIMTLLLAFEQLDAGKIKADIKTSDNKRVSFTVRTPIATASVKGTAGSVSALGDVVSYENVWATTVINPDGTESTKQIPVSQGMHLSLSANVGSNSPVTLTLASDTGVSPLLQNVSEIENEFKGISFASDSGNHNGAQIPSGVNNIDTTCYVNVDVTYKK